MKRSCPARRWPASRRRLANRPLLDRLEDRLAPAVITGVVWSDLNGDGVKAAQGEPGIAGRTVYLDLNRSGTFDSGDATSTTDANGAYRFDNLLSGNYWVGQVTPPAGSRPRPGRRR